EPRPFHADTIVVVTVRLYPCASHGATVDSIKAAFAFWGKFSPSAQHPDGTPCRRPSRAKSFVYAWGLFRGRTAPRRRGGVGGSFARLSRRAKGDGIPPRR